MIDQIVLGDTLKKINASLNKRFEKDADLYISKQDEYEIKRLLCNNKYAAVVNKSVGDNIKAEIILKVIVRNAGVLSISHIGTFEKELKPILSDVDYESVAYMMEDVLNNTVFMGKDLKRLLFRYYINGICYAERIDYWDDEYYTLDTRERKELFFALIQGDQEDEPSFDEKWDFIIDAVNEYKQLLNDSKLFLNFKRGLSPEDEKNLFIKVCNEMRNLSVTSDLYDNVIISTYASFGDSAFNDALKAIREGHRNYKLFVKTLVELLRAKEENGSVLTRFDTFYRLYQSSLIERHIKTEIDRKIWKAAKQNQDLYQQRKAQIDNFMPEEKVQCYNNFSEVFEEVQQDKKPANIGYMWVNMKPQALKQSLVAAYSYEGWDEYSDEMEDVFVWMFRHNQRRSPSQFKKICTIFAESLLDLGEIKGQFAVLADRILLENIIKHSVKGKLIKDYLTTYHFDEYKSDYVE